MYPEWTFRLQPPLCFSLVAASFYYKAVLMQKACNVFLRRKFGDALSNYKSFTHSLSKGTIRCLFIENSKNNFAAEKQTSLKYKVLLFVFWHIFWMIEVFLLILSFCIKEFVRWKHSLYVLSIIFVCLFVYFSVSLCVNRLAIMLAWCKKLAMRFFLLFISWYFDYLCFNILVRSISLEYVLRTETWK